ncbi:MAG: HAMP domain-containing sensor histidine kinase, partial [Campylobacterota bacterium]|nr:HAMP domain-containing sensor histidine kinase [Campylobacterota bacterium]
DNILIQQSKQAIIGEMFENITHQWKQPLNLISMLSANIRIDKEFGTLDDDKLNELLEGIEDSSSHLSQTVEDFRNFLNDDNIKEYFKIKSTIEQTVKLLSSRINNNSVKIIINIDEIEVYSFKNNLIQVIMNLIGNSLDIIEIDKVENKTITFNYEIENGNFILYVDDNAGGIDENIIDSIFDKYFTTKSNGTGLGLYMSRKIVQESMDGAISVTNKNGGVSFKLSFPYKSLPAR